MAVAPKLLPFDYVLEQDRSLPKEEQTTWHLRPLTYEEKELVQPEIVTTGKDDVKVTLQAMTTARKILNFGLEGWTNFCDVDGNEVEFQKAKESFMYGKKGRNKREFLPDHILNAIEPYALELSNAVTAHSEVREDAAKNSG